MAILTMARAPILARHAPHAAQSARRTVLACTEAASTVSRVSLSILTCATKGASSFAGPASLSASASASVSAAATATLASASAVAFAAVNASVSASASA